MNRFLRVVVAVTMTVTVASPVSAGSAHSASSDQAFVDELLYSTTMKDFLADVDSDKWYDWSTDFCSAPLVGNTGRSFNFTDPCRRHDFGYRNLHLIERRYGTDAWNDSSRKRVDRQFLADMRSHCKHRSWWDEPTCFAWAQTFYTAVRLAGNM